MGPALPSPPLRPRRRRWVAACILPALAACATAPPDEPALRPARLAGTDRIVLGADGPDRSQAPLLLLRPGFTRRCEHLAGTLRALARETPFEVLCLQPEPGDDPAWRDLAGPLAALQRPLLLAGHSAGAGQFATLALAAAQAGAAVAGVLMVDPVADARFGGTLDGLARRGVPVRAWLAPAHACNAQGQARTALQAHGALTVEAPPDATHADLEGEDSDALATWACGRPQPAATAALRRWLAATARALAGTAGASGTRPPAPSSGRLP